MLLRPPTAPSSFVRTLFASCLLLLVALPLGACGHIDDSDIKNVSLGEVSALVAARDKDPMSLALVDGRAPQDYAAAHIPGAVNLLITDFPEDRARDKRYDAYERIIVYGKDPASPPAKALTKRMMRVGYSDVTFFAGGLNEWIGAGKPTESAKK